jgi:arabinogalactan oligomer/maltooligosaccharide transport system substrate-binding protein
MNPLITVERAHHESNDLRELFLAASREYSAPDVVRVQNDFAGSFSSPEFLAPVNRLFDENFLNQYLPGSLDPAIVKETLWGIPDNYGNHLMLIYNKSLIDSPPNSFEDLIAQAKNLTRDGIMGFTYNLNEPFWGAGFYAAFGGWPLDPQGKPSFNNPAFIEYLSFVSRLKTDGIVPPECGYDCENTLFLEGKAAMIINGDWSLAEYSKKLGDKLGVAPVPPINGRPFAEMISGQYFMVSSTVLDNFDKKVSVQLFITYMTSAEVQQQWLDIYKRLPSNKELAKEVLLTNDPILNGSMAALANGRSMPAVAAMRCVWNAWRPNLEGVMAGTISPVDAAAAAQEMADNCAGTLTP